MYWPNWVLILFGKKCGKDADHQFDDGKDLTSSDDTHYKCKRCGDPATAPIGYPPKTRD